MTDGLRFATDDDLYALTRKRNHKCQARELVNMGIRFKPRADGSPAVLAAEIERHLLTGVGAPRRRTLPDLAALG